MKRKLFLIIIPILSILFLSACSSPETTIIQPEMMGGGGMMGDNETMHFHMAAIPETYDGVQSSVPLDVESIEQGQVLYTANCAVCHGDGGMGDGPAGVSLDPTPAKIAHTSQMLSDAYLYWRISEGGTEFGTAMISYKTMFSEEDRWNVINYIRALGSNEIMPIEQFGGELNDPEAQAAEQAEMLSKAVENEILSREEADFFDKLHILVDDFIQNNRIELSESELPMMESGLEALVENGSLTEEEANLFMDIHDRLVTADLMQ